MTENFWCPLPCLNKRISEICLRFFYRYLQYCQDSIRQNCKIKKYNDLWLSIKIELFLQNLPYCSLHLILRKYITLLSCHLLNMPSIKKKRKKTMKISFCIPTLLQPFSLFAFHSSENAFTSQNIARDISITGMCLKWLHFCREEAIHK